MAEPMTDAELAAIESAYTISDTFEAPMVRALIAEVRRLRGEVERQATYIAILRQDEEFTKAHCGPEASSIVADLRARLVVCETDLDAAQKEAAKYFAGSQKWARRAEAAEKALAVYDPGDSKQSYLGAALRAAADEPQWATKADKIKAIMRRGAAELDRLAVYEPEVKDETPICWGCGCREPYVISGEVVCTQCGGFMVPHWRYLASQSILNGGK